MGDDRGRKISFDEMTGEMKVSLRGKPVENLSKQEVLQYTVETDLMLYGAVHKDTLEVLRQEGYRYLNGSVQKNPDGKSISKFPDNLDEYTYDLMEGICGKEHMMFEVRGNSDKYLREELVEDILSKEKYIEVSFSNGHSLQIAKHDYDLFAVQMVKYDGIYNELQLVGNKEELPSSEVKSRLMNSSDTLLSISADDRVIFESISGLDENYEKELELYKNPERQDTMYIVEEKLDRNGVDSYTNSINNMRSSGSITEEKHAGLIDRVNDGWVISDSLSYSSDYESILDLYKDMQKQMPGKDLRVVKAYCVYHYDRGISLADFDYTRIEIMKLRHMPAHEKEGLINNYANEFKAAKYFSDKDLRVLSDFNSRFPKPVTIKEMIEKYYANNEKIKSLTANIEDIKEKQGRLSKAEGLLGKYDNLLLKFSQKDKGILKSLFPSKSDNSMETDKVSSDINKLGVKNRHDFIAQSYKLKEDVAKIPIMENELIECNSLAKSLRAVVDVLNRALNKESELTKEITRSRSMDIER